MHGDSIIFADTRRYTNKTNQLSSYPLTSGQIRTCLFIVVLVVVVVIMNFMLYFKTKLAFLVALFGCIIPGILLYVATDVVSSLWLKLVAGLLVAMSGGVSLILLQLMMQRTTPHQSIKKLLLHFVLSTATSLKARSVLPKFRDTLKRPSYYQKRLLQNILRDNKDTAYGKDFDLASMKSVEDFRCKHPLTKYDHYRPYVQRMLDGEDQVLTRVRPKGFTRTSGTTGQPKHFPLLDRQGILVDIAAVVTGIITEVIPDLGPLQKRLQYYVHPVTSRSKGGIPIETALTFSAENALLMSMFSTPPAGFTIMTLYEANYIQLLFSLRDKYIGVIACNFVALLETMIHQLETCWQDIVHDIEHGTILSSLTLDAAVRDQLTRELKGKGDPARAEELRREFEKGFQDIIPRVWPYVKIVVGVDHQDIRFRLARKYTGDIPIYSFVIGASEGLIAFNPWPLEKKLGYVPSFLHNFYEFIPLAEIGQAQPKTFLPEELEVGQSYEIVITQSSGLYRYRMGDVINVTGFEQATPVFEFSYRIGQILNFFYEKIDQNVLHDSIKAAVDHWNDDVELRHYSVAESTLITKASEGNATPYYIIFIELNGIGTVSEDQKGMIDKELRARGVDYEKLRHSNTIAPPRIHIVRPGAFRKLQDYSVTKGGACEIQYKVPCKLMKVELVEILMEQVY